MTALGFGISPIFLRGGVSIPASGLLLDIDPQPSKVRGTGARDLEASDSEYFAIADNAALSTGDIDFSVAIFVKSEALAGTDDIIGKGQYTGSTREWKLAYTSSRFNFFVSTNGQATIGIAADTLGEPSDGQWYFIVAWHDASANTINIQIDGGAVDSAATSGSAPSDRTGKFFAGIEDTVYAQYWDGLIARPLFAKRVWTAAERTALFASGNGLNKAQLDAHATLSDYTEGWHSDGLPGTDLVSFSGSNDLTQNNAPGSADGPAAVAVEDVSANGSHGVWNGNSTAWKTSVAHGAISFKQIDGSGGGNDGHLQGTPAPSVITDVVTGATGKALYLDQGGAIKLLNESNFDQTTKLSVSGWVYLLDSARQGMASKSPDGSSASGGWSCDYGGFTAGQVEFGVIGGSGKYIFAGAAMSTGAWHHVVGVFDSSEAGNDRVRLYIDGALQSATYTTAGSFTTILANNTPVYIGLSNETSANTFNGYLDEFRCYSDSLTAAEVDFLWKSHRNVAGGTDPGTVDLVAHLSLGDEYSLANISGGMCLDHDGVDDRVDAGDPTTFDYAGGDFTVSGWFQKRSNGQQNFLSKDADSARQFGIELDEDGDGTNKILFFVGKSGGVLFSVTSDADGFINGIWNHLACVRDGSSLLIYVNGVSLSVTPTGTAGDMLATSSNLLFGANELGGGSDYLDGLLDYIQIHSSGLTAANIETLYEGTDVGTPAGHWPMNDGPQNDPADSTPIAILTSSEGQNYDFTQLTISKRPLLRLGANGINNQPAVQCAGVDDFLEYVGDLSDQTAVIEIFAVVEVESTVNEELAVISTADTSVADKYWLVSARRNDANPKMSVHSHDGTTEHLMRGSTTIATGAARLLSASANGTATVMEVDGTAETEVDEVGTDAGAIPTDTSGRDSWTIGAWKGNSEDLHLPGKIARILIYDHVLTAAERTQLENYVESTYGITI